MNTQNVKERFNFEFSEKNNERKISGIEVIIHCHHYNSRLHKIIEGASEIEGKSIIRSSAERVFADKLKHVFSPDDSVEAKWELAKNLYSHLGYGNLDFSQAKEGFVSSDSSHFVEGWRICFPIREEPVCTFSEGFIQGVIFSITGESVNVREKECMISGAKKCIFIIEKNRETPVSPIKKFPFSLPDISSEKTFMHSNIDEEKVRDGLTQFPFYGNEEGLIPAFSVLLANIPADYYNSICIQYVEEMEKVGLIATAQKMLVLAAENCGMNTFRGILASKEWEKLIGPMIQNEHDKISGLISVINNLGWGLWKILEHLPGETLTIASRESYEGLGYLEHRGYSESSKCYCHTGVSAGIMQLIYGKGTLEQRYGLFYSEEKECLAAKGGFCVIKAERI